MRIIAVHGVGTHAKDFHQAWADKLREGLPGESIEVLGLRWSDEQDEVADRFPVASERLQSVMGRIGIGAVEEFRGSAAHDVIRSHIYDVFAYSFLHELRHYLQTKALIELLDIADGRAQDTVIVAHSLGAALMMHAAALIRRLSGSVPFRGVVLLAPPFGIRSPVKGIPDPLAVSPDSALPTSIHSFDGLTAQQRMAWARARDYGAALSEEDRESMLLNMCNDWPTGRLHFVVNKNDVICSDVRLEFADRKRDIISMKQGFSDNEKAILQAVAKLHELEFGAPQVDKIGRNHDALNYLSQPEVIGILKGLFA